MLRKLTRDFTFTASADDIKNETMVFSASPEFAYRNGGTWTRNAVHLLENIGAFDDTDNIVIDTRVHMLMPGMLPAIGGWHCDAIPRGDDGQPDFSRRDVIDHIRHYLLIVDAGTGALTEFLAQTPDEFPQSPPPSGKTVWGHHSELIEGFLADGSLQKTAVESGHLYQFSARDYHRAIPATGSGWRFFLRASVNTMTRGPLNEIRNQVQVYLPSEHLGW